VDEAGELDVGDVAGGAVDAFEVPDGFGSGYIVIGVLWREYVKRVFTLLGRSHRGIHHRCFCQRHLEYQH
jgi:hypothetical protein